MIKAPRRKRLGPEKLILRALGQTRARMQCWLKNRSPSNAKPLGLGSSSGLGGRKSSTKTTMEAHGNNRSMQPWGLGVSSGLRRDSDGGRCSHAFLEDHQGAEQLRPFVIGCWRRPRRRPKKCWPTNRPQASQMLIRAAEPEEPTTRAMERRPANTTTSVSNAHFGMETARANERRLDRRPANAAVGVSDAHYSMGAGRANDDGDGGGRHGSQPARPWPSGMLITAWGPEEPTTTAMVAEGTAANRLGHGRLGCSLRHGGRKSQRRRRWWRKAQQRTGSAMGVWYAHYGMGAGRANGDGDGGGRNGSQPARLWASGILIRAWRLEEPTMIAMVDNSLATGSSHHLHAEELHDDGRQKERPDEEGRPVAGAEGLEATATARGKGRELRH